MMTIYGMKEMVKNNLQGIKNKRKTKTLKTKDFILNKVFFNKLKSSY